MTIDAFKKRFTTSKPCAIMIGMIKSPPFEFTGISAALPSEIQNISNVKQNELAWAIVNAVNNFPSAVVEAARQFVRSVFGAEGFVGVHWRYDHKDFYSHCQGIENWICADVYNITPQHVATAMYNDLKKFFPQFSCGINIYIASPPSIIGFTDQIFDRLRQFNSTFRRPSLTLNQFMVNRFGACMEKNHWNFGDTLSRVEQALMVQSDYFYFSAVSSWSQNCRNARWYQPHGGAKPRMKYEANVYKLSSSLINKPLD